jgi:hypothetical protein
MSIYCTIYNTYNFKVGKVKVLSLSIRNFHFFITTKQLVISVVLRIITIKMHKKIKNKLIFYVS